MCNKRQVKSLSMTSVFTAPAYTSSRPTPKTQVPSGNEGGDLSILLQAQLALDQSSHEVHARLLLLRTVVLKDVQDALSSRSLRRLLRRHCSRVYACSAWVNSFLHV